MRTTGKEICQRCGALEAIYNPVMESAALCPLCAQESRERKESPKVAKERAAWNDSNYNERECGE